MDSTRRTTIAGTFLLADVDIRVITIKLPLEDCAEVVSLWISYISLRSLIISWSDVVHYVVDNLLNLVRVDVNQTWWNLTLCVLEILEVEWRNVTILADVNHTTGLTLAEELVNAHTEL